MNKRTMVAVCFMVAALSAGSALAADQTYLAVRAGAFLPNGNGSSDYKGLEYFDNGYNIEIAAGYRPVPYAALEIGTGYYTAEGKVSNDNFSIDRTVSGVPITLTAKGILEFDRLILSAGAGLGLYQAFIDNKITLSDPDSKPPVDESNHGAAPGYHVVFDADFKLTEKWEVGANFKWFSARPEIEMNNVYKPTSSSYTYDTSKDEWEVGGTIINVGVKYLF